MALFSADPPVSSAPEKVTLTSVGSVKFLQRRGGSGAGTDVFILAAQVWSASGQPHNPSAEWSEFEW